MVSVKRLAMLAVLAMAGLMSVTASAVDWAYVDSGKLSTSYVDTDSISNSSGYKTAFHKYELSKPTSIAGGASVDRITSFSKYDCRSTPKRIKTLKMAAFYGDYFIQEDDKEKPWEVVYPGSMNEGVANFVCSYRK